MKKIVYVVIITIAFITCGCDNFTTKHFGGTTTINLEPGEKLIEATWKDSNIWYLVEPMEDDYIPKTKVFKECSIFGVMEGKIIFIETK